VPLFPPQIPQLTCSRIEPCRRGGKPSTKRLSYKTAKTNFINLQRTIKARMSEEWCLLGCYDVVPSSPIVVTLMKEELSSSERSVFTRATWRNIPEDAILHSHRRENLKSYKNIRGFHRGIMKEVANLDIT
jgi:hypothetical protein